MLGRGVVWAVAIVFVFIVVGFVILFVDFLISGQAL